MAGLPWIKLDVVVVNHPKLQRLEKALGIEDGLGVAVRMWCWTATYYPDGEIPAHAVASMAVAALGHVTARPDEGVAFGNTSVTLGARDVTDALVEVGLLEPHDGRYVVHDWSQHQQAHADKAQRDKEQNAERQRRFRNRARNAGVTVTRNVTDNVTVTQSNGGEERRVEEKKKPARKASPPSPPPFGFKAAQSSLVAAFADVRGGKYLWQGAKDTEGLKRVLALGVPLSEILDRWRSGLKAKGWASCSTVAQLAAKWNDLEVDADEARFRRIREEAERELDRARPGDGGVARPPEPSSEPRDPLPAFGASLSAAVGAVLGGRGEAGGVQDSDALEHRAEHGRAETPRSVR